MEQLIEQEFKRGGRRRIIARIRVGTFVDKSQGHCNITTIQRHNQLPIEGILLPLPVQPPATGGTQRKNDSYGE